MSDSRTKRWRESKSVVSVILIIVFVALLTAVIVVWKLNSFDQETTCSSKECVDSAFFFLEVIDLGVDPCANFYNFTCGNYKGDLVVGNLQNGIDRTVKELIVGPVRENDSRSVKLQKKYYQACMNVTAIEDENEALRKLFRKLGNWPVLAGNGWKDDEFNWGNVVEKCKDVGLYYDWFINIDKAEYENRLQVSPPNNVNKIDPKLKQKYVNLMTNVVRLLGAPINISNVSESMKDVATFEIELSKIIESETSDPKETEYVADDVKSRFPHMPWPSIFKNVTLPKNDKIVFVNMEGYLNKLKELLDKTSKRIQANYIFWKLTESFSAFLSYKIRKEFETYSGISRYYRFPRDRKGYCYGITSTVFAYISEAEYVRRHSAARKPVQRMVENVKSVLYYHLGNAKWLSQSDRSLAFFKLRNMKVIIGGPEEMYDEDGFEHFLGVDLVDILDRNNTIEIICQVDRSRDLYNLDFVKPKHTPDQARFYQVAVLLGHTQYLPEENLMFLPAAALDVFYSQNRPAYLNYGALGNVIAHELVHGFGLLGNTAYEDGEEKILWTNHTHEHFLAQAECLLENCNKIGIDNNFWMNCKDTFEESFADYVGVNLAFEAYRRLQRDIGEEKNLPGITYGPLQLFWMTYASIMCNNVAANRAESSRHMLPFQRIVGAFRNSDYFAEEFECPVGSNMNPAEKCNIL